MHYLLKGVQVLFQPGYRKFILVPIVANVLFFIALSIFMVGLFSDTMSWFMGFIPSWLEFMSYFLWVVFVLVFLIAYGFSFTMITNLFAAPFNGFLAEKIQRDLGQDVPEVSIAEMIVRSVKREIQKLIYFVWYGLLVMLGLFILSFVPLLNLMAPVIAFMWAAWCMAIQYMDYPADNNLQEFKQLRSDAKKPWVHTYGFGGLTSLLVMVPVVNIFVMPVAVAGGTLLWLSKIHQPESEFDLDDVAEPAQIEHKDS
ncbi:sulfate transporter CysZ [Bermanella sp. R86510]|uniref:sulfate transporter CysZ n=1 Tax=unclassified Bermanella TaxID=2627862 RepID=UPI0037C7E0F2